jgi:hypothetical protein
MAAARMWSRTTAITIGRTTADGKTPQLTEKRAAKGPLLFCLRVVDCPGRRRDRQIPKAFGAGEGNLVCSLGKRIIRFSRSISPLFNILKLLYFTLLLACGDYRFQHTRSIADLYGCPVAEKTAYERKSLRFSDQDVQSAISYGESAPTEPSAIDRSAPEA